MTTESPNDLHVQLGTTEERLAAVLEAVVNALPRQQYYVFRSPPSSAPGGASPKPKIILAFRSPDDAISFAQRHHLGDYVRVRGITSMQLLRHMLSTSSIGTVLFLQEMSPDPDVRALPRRIRITREWLLARLHS